MNFPEVKKDVDKRDKSSSKERTWQYLPYHPELAFSMDLPL